MKNIKNNIFKAGLFAVALTSFSACIEETEPMSSTVTTEQVQGQSSATTSLALAMPAKFNTVMWGGEKGHYEFGMGACMQIRDQFTQDLCEGGDNGRPVALDENTMTGQAFRALAEAVVRQVEVRNATGEATRIVKTK